MKLLSHTTIYTGYLVVFIAVVLGVLPRDVMLVMTVIGIVALLLTPIEDGVLFFIKAIPLFVALPLTASFDNMNMWRPFSLVLICRYLWEPAVRRAVFDAVRAALRSPVAWLKAHPVIRRSAILLILAGLSLIGSTYPSIGVLRIIYFVNLSMVPVLTWGLLRTNRLSTERVMWSVATAVCVTVDAGYLQLLSTYVLDVYQFMSVWGDGIQLRQFGTQWAYIVVWMGNTWLAYYGDQLSLRMFSLFPDSHSFPTFVLLGLPAILALSIRPVIARAREAGLWSLMRTYASWGVLWVPAALLTAILSGTRGIWAASIGVIVLVPLWQLLMRRTGIDVPSRRVFIYVASYISIFFLLFPIAWPIFTSPQFLLSKSDGNLFQKRIRSVIDFGETSNAQRIAIWKASLVSIREHPLLGVGIGNFPVVLNQRIDLSRAGSSAHNLYLHVAAEMGLVALFEVCALLFSALRDAYRWFERSRGVVQAYAAATLLFLPWVLAYVLTDPILFDERVFLLFATTLAMIWAGTHD